MNIKVEVSAGELLDKITILEIKSERIHDAGKLVNINKELMILRSTWDDMSLSDDGLEKLYSDLKAINEKLWDIEDNIRTKESKAAFDDEFIELARSVYIVNDKRSHIKKEINCLLGSDLTEEKSYADYSRV